MENRSNKQNKSTENVQPSSSSGPVPSQASTSQSTEGTNGTGQGSTMSVESYITSLEKYLTERPGLSPSSKKQFLAALPTAGVKLLQKLQEMYGNRYITIKSPGRISVAPGEPMELPYLAFYAEWRTFLGPGPDEPMAPATPFVPDVEAMMFPTLFPYGMGQYLGPEGHPTPLTFEEYAQHRLMIVDARFRESQEWLLWALTRTESRDLAAAINCALVLFHNMKARYLGSGETEVLDISDVFEARKLLDGKLVKESVNEE